MKSSIEIEKLDIVPSDKLFLYRYITIDKLMDCLLNKRFPLTRLNLFEDKLEGITPQNLSLNLASDKIGKEIAPWIGEIVNHITLNINPIKRNSLRRQKLDFQKYNFASCWFVNDHESVAMWQLYSSPDSIAIKIPVNSFLGELDSKRFDLTGYNHKKIRYGSVKYYRFDDIGSLSQLVTNENIQGFLKDKSFSHESEFRVILSVEENERKRAEKKPMILDEQIEDLNRKLDQHIIYILFENFKNMPFELIFHPQASDWHKSNVKQTIKKYEVDFPIIESKLTRIFN
ncbi:hypothetical protein [Roseivirga sp.]|uniref:hypothetical protein n=1 Tax=Roseivirga sp. TaxID=1964215 RepID=UPI002B277ECC|nr:hypothetical protein [Roseivirga sp.]